MSKIARRIALASMMLASIGGVGDAISPKRCSDSPKRIGNRKKAVRKPVYYIDEDGNIKRKKIIIEVKK